MKHLNKTLASLLLLTAILFVGCNTEQEGAIYKADEQSFSFGTSALADQVVTVGKPDFTVDLYRAKLGEPASGNITLFAYKLASDGKTKIPQEGYSVSNYNFDANSGIAQVTVNAEPLAVGDHVKIELTVETDGVALSGSTVATMSVTKDYSWKPIGTGVWKDGIVCSLFGVPVGVTWEVEVEEAAELSGMYRVINPYGYGKCPWVEESEVTIDPCYVKINASNPDKVSLANQKLGFAWDYGEFMAGSTQNVGYPGDFGTKVGKDIDFGALFVAMGGDIYTITAGGGLTLP